MMARDERERPRGRDDVVFRALVDEWVLYDPQTRRIHVLNHTAALVWLLCDGSHDEGTMVQALCDLIPDAPDPAVLGEHIRKALATFAGEGLLA